MENQRKYKAIMITFSVMMVLVLLSSIFIGRYSLSPKQVLDAIFSPEKVEDIQKTVLFDIRIPRVLMSLLVGVGLSMAGITYQAVLMNPLASPDVLGTSSAAAFGAALGILLFPQSFVMICVLSFAFGMVSIFMVFAIARIKQSQEILTIVLSGMIVGSIFMSFIAVIKYLADTEDTLPAITFWLMGSFSAIDMEQLIFTLPIFILCFMILYSLRWKLNILSLGDEEAIVAKLNPRRLRLIALGTASVIVSLSVTVAGVIGWVGLAIPHLTRSLVGYNHGRLAPVGGIIGGIFLLCIDDLARSVGFSEIPIGMLTALIGAPIFMILFLRGEKQ